MLGNDGSGRREVAAGASGSHRGRGRRRLFGLSARKHPLCFLLKRRWETGALSQPMEVLQRLADFYVVPPPFPLFPRVPEPVPTAG